MDKQNVQAAVTVQSRHRDRMLQTPIYLGKLLRGFLYQSDWKVLPMSVVIAALLSLVVRNTFFVTREGTLKGAFALACVALWNGCFNSILVVCRERRIVKREHRSGMHISSYMLAHMIYQAMLCLAQSVLTIYVCKLLGVKFPTEGIVTPWFMVDLGITVFLVTYAASMTSLFLSSLAHTTTAALTVMPFLLIFQLVFSGGIFQLPAWTSSISNFTLSNYGLRCIAAEADYNNQPMMLAWDTLNKCTDENIHVEITAGEIIRMSTAENSPVAKVLHRTKVEVLDGETVGSLLDALVEAGALEEYENDTYSADFTLKDIFETVGPEKAKQAVISMTSNAGRNDIYERSLSNVLECWGSVVLIGMVFAALSVIAMEFIDKDKR